MQVSVFYSAGTRAVLIMPASKTLELPESVSGMAWAPMQDTSLGDPLLHHAAPVIEAEISAYGFSVLPLVEQTEEGRKHQPFWRRWRQPER